MSFQAYLDNIQAKTGKSVAEFQAMAAERAGLHCGMTIMCALAAVSRPRCRRP
jgi:hypothetical protein